MNEFIYEEEEEYGDGIEWDGNIHNLQTWKNTFLLYHANISVPKDICKKTEH